MRYTAATVRRLALHRCMVFSQDPQCDPDDFTKEYGWSLRVSNYGRPTDLLIAVTSYNEVSFMTVSLLN